MIFIIIYCSLFSQMKVNNIVLIMAWSLAILLLHILTSLEPDRSSNKIDTIQIVFVYTFVYFIMLYVIGIFVGFTRNPYSLNLIDIAKNIIPLIIIIILEEFFRFNIIVKGKDNKIILVTMIILFIVSDVFLNVNHFSLNTGMDIFEVIGILILPSIVNNIVLTFISQKSGCFPPILYRILIECLVYVVPITPALNIYLESVFRIVFPTILFLKFNTVFAINRFSKIKRKNLVKQMINVILTIIVIAIVSLVSGLFTYSAMSIGSNSMHPYFNRGDAVILKKMEPNEEIKEGMIVAYRHDDKVIAHRILTIDNDENQIVIRTKGDNNNSQDNWTFTKSDIIGIVEYHIPFIGYPSVWLTELFKK
jgi:signal peptidase